jgi:predicted nucleic acid-binding protein
MIVVDSNILAYLFLPGEYTEAAEALLTSEANWVAPALWRSEFRNILAGYVRRKTLTLKQACDLQEEAESLMRNGEYEVQSQQVLQLVSTSDCSAYDCEFVSLAHTLGCPLVTMDGKVLRAFPNVTRALVVRRS